LLSVVVVVVDVVVVLLFVALFPVLAHIDVALG
jgi:hypothetical protein